MTAGSWMPNFGPLGLGGRAAAGATSELAGVASEVVGVSGAAGAAGAAGSDVVDA